MFLFSGGDNGTKDNFHRIGWPNKSYESFYRRCKYQLPIKQHKQFQKKEKEEQKKMRNHSKSKLIKAQKIRNIKVGKN